MSKGRGDGVWARWGRNEEAVAGDKERNLMALGGQLCLELFPDF